MRSFPLFSYFLSLFPFTQKQVRNIITQTLRILKERQLTFFHQLWFLSIGNFFFFFIIIIFNFVYSSLNMICFCSKGTELASLNTFRVSTMSYRIIVDTWRCISVQTIRSSIQTILSSIQMWFDPGH
jgi:hypothetical protein